MRWLLRSRAQTTAALVIFVVLGAIGFLPLFDGPGYESALAAGLLVPAAAAIAVAFDVLLTCPQPLDAYSHAVASGASLAGVAYLTTLLHGARTGFCDPSGGTVAFALGPGVGALMGGLFGAIAGEVAGHVKKRWLRSVTAVVLALSGPLTGIVLSIVRFYKSPIIFAFDPFFGFFSGTIYDTVIDATLPLLNYRIGSALTILAAGVLAAHLVRDQGGRISLRSIGRPGLAMAGALCATASLLLQLEGWRLGHWQTAATISADLGARISGARCDVIYSSTLREEDARLFARDCDGQVRAVERYFEVGDTGRYTAYLFRDAAEKRRLMGAADTLIAKPWRREVYVQAAGFPHPVLGHELAHAVAGTFAVGPLRVAGGRSGYRINPGLIEGTAVAASPGEDEDLTPAEWSRAMLDLKLLPPLSKVFALGFLGENAAKSYTVAGAFVGYIHDVYGTGAVRRWYGGEPIEQVTGKSLSDLEGAWQAALAQATIPEQAAAIARARFDRPSVFGRRCPHAVDQCRKDARSAESQGDFSEASRSYEHLLRLDPHDDGARLGLAVCQLRLGSEGEAKKRLEALAADERGTRSGRDHATAMLADLDLASGNAAPAAHRYAELARRTLDEDELRTIEVKTTSLEDARARSAVGALLVGTPDRGVDPVAAAALLGAWTGQDPTDGLPEYLLGKQAVSRGLYGVAADRLDRALAKRLPLGRVTREALRQRVIVACALGDGVAARKAYDIWLAKGEPSTARKEAMWRFFQRCHDGALAERGVGSAGVATPP